MITERQVGKNNEKKIQRNNKKQIKNRMSNMIMEITWNQTKAGRDKTWEEELISEEGKENIKTGLKKEYGE
jgi:hypothetical protein